MDKRLELHSFLKNLITPYEVYYQPPASLQMTYPCIIYKLANIRIEYADSIKYNKARAYEITVIDRNPDSQIPDKLLNLDYCEFDRHFINDNLNHYVFTLFYSN